MKQAISLRALLLAWCVAAGLAAPAWAQAPAAVCTGAGASYWGCYSAVTGLLRGHTLPIATPTGPREASIGQILDLALQAAQAAIGPTVAAKADYSGVFGIVPDSLKLPADGTDDAPSFQRAIAAVCAGQSQVIRFLPRLYRMQSGVTQACAVHWIGQGWQEPNGGNGTAVPGLGSWIQIVGTGFAPFVVTTPAAGSIFEGFGVYQTHPAPAVGWTPTNYPPVFTINYAGGEVTYRHLMMLAVKSGFSAYAAGRMKFEDIRGQFFSNAITIDKSYDSTSVTDLHSWPYWSQDANVIAYQQSNLDGIILGRVDDFYGDRLFQFGGRSHLKLTTTPDDASSPSWLPGGSPSVVLIGTLRSDFTRWALWVTATPSNSLSGQVSIARLVHQGQVWNVVTPLPNSAAIELDGFLPLISVGYAYIDFPDHAFLRGTGTGASNVQISTAHLSFDRCSGPACYYADTGTAPTTLTFGLPPVVTMGTNSLSRTPSGGAAIVKWAVPQ